MATESAPVPLTPRRARIAWASWGEIGRWTAVAATVAATLLTGVALVAVNTHGTYAAGLDSGLLVRHHGFGDALYVFRRNLLVLGIHLCACWIGAILGRPYRPAPESMGRLGRLHRPVPDWMGRIALLWALLVTLLSVGVQALALGRLLADISVAADIPRLQLLVLVLPHAVPELLAVFLPLGLFLLEAHRGRLERLGLWSLQAAAIALPVLLCAAAIETYVTPARVIAASHHAALIRAHAAAVSR
ncbi:MAG TPA: stage II sporulation protein M [Solirubrobacteraceae bacterium]|nr:stage II sporulation protein M [Solirubrobacteraceae bacterium]